MPKKSKKKDSENDIKIIIIGSPKTGKTSFNNKWTKWIFSDTYRKTEVSEFGFKIFEYEGKLYRIQMWDLGGEDKNLMVTKIFAKDAHGIINICDATDIETRKKILETKSNIDLECKFIDGGIIPSILVENKSDLLEDGVIEGREKEIKKFSEENGFDGGFLVFRNFLIL